MESTGERVSMNVKNAVGAYVCVWLRRCDKLRTGKFIVRVRVRFLPTLQR